MLDWSLVALAVALAVLLLGALATVLRYRIRTLAAASWRPEDVSHLQVAPPPAVRSFIEQLAALGFRRLGEAGRPELADRAGRAQVWYLIDRDATTVAGVFAVGSTASAVIYSWFGDEAVIVTGYPHGEHIEEAAFRFHTITTGIEDAYRHHRDQLPDFEMRYGAPDRLDSMAEVLRLDALYNRKFAARRQRPAMLRELATPAFQLYLIVVVLGMVAALQLFELPPLPVVIGAALLALPAVVWYASTRLQRRRR